MSRTLAQLPHDSIIENIPGTNDILKSPKLSPSKKAAARSRVVHLSKLLSQWVPTRKFLHVAAIVDEDNDNIIASSPGDVAAKLAACWSPFISDSDSTFDPVGAR